MKRRRCKHLWELINKTMILKRFLYLAYYFKEMDRQKLHRFVQYAHAVHPRGGWEGFSLWKDILGSSLRYNISILDYFYFRFFEIEDASKRQSYAGTDRKSTRLNSIH